VFHEEQQLEFWQLCVGAMGSQAHQTTYFEGRLRQIMLDHQDALRQLMADLSLYSHTDHSVVGITSDMRDRAGDDPHDNMQASHQSAPILEEAPSSRDPKMPNAEQNNRQSNSAGDSLVVASNMGSARMLRSCAGIRISGDVQSEEEKIRSFMHDNRDLRQILGKAFGPVQALVSACEQLDEPERSGLLASFINAVGFEIIVVCMIFANCIYTIMTTNWEVAHIGQERPHVLKIIDNTFLGFYLLELILRLLVHRCFFFL